MNNPQRFVGQPEWRLRFTAHCIGAIAIVSSLAACDRAAPPVEVAPASGNPEISWAGAALARNPNLEVLATDVAAGVFTVRSRSSGQVQTVKLTELAAAPIAELSMPAATPNGVAGDQPDTMKNTPAAPEPVAPVAAPPATAAPANDAKLAETSAPTTANPLPASAGNDAEKSYTIERAGGQVKVSGPGVSIVSSGTSGASPPANATAQDTAGPIICEGHRMLHLDNRAINSRSDAVIARGGCELHITNSRITAAGTAVIVQNAVVHIANSSIEGGTASFEADDRARLFLRSNTFKGLPRRDEHAVVQDQGGNQWR